MIVVKNHLGGQSDSGKNQLFSNKRAINFKK